MPLVTQDFLFDKSDFSVSVADAALQSLCAILGNGSSTAMNK